MAHNRENRNSAAIGATYLAAVLMIILGFFEALQGLSAVIKKSYFVVGSNYLWKLNVTGWGWIHLVLGIVVLLAGIGLIGGALWARVVGVVLAGVVAIANFLWLPYQPLWSAIIIAVTCLTNAGASGGTTGGRSRRLLTADGNGTSNRCSSARSTAAKFCSTRSLPLRPYVAWIAPLILAMASSRGSTSEIAKKHVCMIVLMRPDMPAAAATVSAS